MFKDLIVYEDLHEACEQSFCFGNVQFLRDFGPWKTGDNAEILWFDLENGEVEEHKDLSDEQVKVVHSCKFKLVAAE